LYCSRRSAPAASPEEYDIYSEVLAKPDELLSEDDAREFVRERFYGSRLGETRQARFAPAIDLIRLANIYFNRDHSVALTNGGGQNGLSKSG
jgi:hypothetical protein